MSRNVEKLYLVLDGSLCCTETDTGTEMGTESGTGNGKTKNVKIRVRHIYVYENI